MNDFYTINNDYAEIIIDKNLYPLTSVKKAISNFMENVYIRLSDNDEKIIIQIKLKDSKIDLENLIGEFYNELLRESLRYDIAIETKNLRELIVGRALYTTCIDLDKNKDEYKIENNGKEKLNIDNENYNIEDIAVNWFNKYSEIEE